MEDISSGQAALAHSDEDTHHIASEKPIPQDNDGTVYLPAISRDASSTTQQPTPVKPTPSHDHDGPVVARVYYRTADDLARLAAELDVWEEAVTNNQDYITALLYPEQLSALQEDGYQVAVDEEMTVRMAGSLSLIDDAEGHQHRTLTDISTIPNYVCYRTVEETYNDLAQLAASSPTLATWSDVGDSWNKVTPGGAAGYDIQALILTNKSIPGPKPKLMIISAIHAREYTTAEMTTRFAEHLIASYDVDPDITWILDYHEVHILPQVNPDGRKIAEGGVLWRKNRNNTNGCFNSSQYGTDLNRNSSFQWGGSGSSGNACSQTYRGPNPLSEPEVQAIQNYASAIFQDQRGPNLNDTAPATTEGVFLTIHSYSELILFPWGWSDTLSPNETQLATLGRKFGYFNGYQVCSDCLYIADGTTDDWAYGELGVAAYTFELGTEFFQQCSVFENTIYPDNLPALIYAAKAARLPYQNPAGPDAINLALSNTTVAAGTAVNLTATINDTRYNSNGQGNEPTQNIQAARYSIDTPSWRGGTTFAMTASDGAFNSKVEGAAATIDTAGLAVGRHTIFVEGQDVNGNWGVTSAIFLTVEPGVGPTPTPTNTVPPTNTPLPTSTPTATNTPQPTNTPTATSTPTPTNTPGPNNCAVFTSSDIPKGLPNGTSSTSSSLSVTGLGAINDLNATINMEHQWVGDLSFTLLHQETGTSIQLIDRPGIPGSTWGCNNDDIAATLDDEAASAVESQCAAGTPTINGTFTPNQSLTSFAGESGNGTWILTINDAYVSADAGTLTGWSLEVCTDVVPPPPTNTPIAPTATPTNTPVPTNTPTPTNTPAPVGCTNYSSGNVPKGLPNGTAATSSSLSVNNGGTISNINVNVDMVHNWVGDLTLSLVHQETGTSITLIDRPGFPGSNWGCSRDDIVTTLDDAAGSAVESQCAFGTPTINGTFKPNQALSGFNGETSSGTWVLNITDSYTAADAGTLNSWSLDICTQ